MVVYADGRRPDYDKMNPELKTRWVEALRSGEYVQGPDVLKKQRRSGEYTYCCLGVLAELMVADGVCETRQNDNDNDYSYSYRVKGANFWIDTMPSHEMEVAAELDGSACSDLAEMNDSGGKTFDEIADYIEEHL